MRVHECEECARYMKKAEYMEVLQREHVDLRNVHTRLNELYSEQSNEMTDKMVKLQKVGDDFAKMKDEFEKLKTLEIHLF